jgi:hypothetical protein
MNIGNNKTTVLNDSRDCGLIAVMPVHQRSRNKRFSFSYLSEFGVGYSTGTAGRHTVVSDCLDVCKCRTGPICSDESAVRPEPQVTVEAVPRVFS